MLQLNRRSMNINLWAKKGKVSVQILSDSNPNTAPTITVDITSPQIVFDSTSNIIKIIETK